MFQRLGLLWVIIYPEWLGNFCEENFSLDVIIYWFFYFSLVFCCEKIMQEHFEL